MKNKLSNLASTWSKKYGKKISLLTMFAFALLMTFSGCQKNDFTSAPDENSDLSANPSERRFHPNTNFDFTNLISDTSEYNPLLLDPNLVNAWGIAFGPTGGIWVSAADTGVSTIYGQNGNILRLPVTIPFGSGNGNPTGQVFNPTTAFIIPSTNQVSKFIFATENGTIAAWASGNAAVTVADRSATGAVYKGLEIVNRGHSWVLYATDFHNGKIDMFDDHFVFIGNSRFADHSIPDGFAPFNIRQIGARLFVTYAKQLAPDNDDDQAGPGNGYVNIFTLDGWRIRRFATQGTLNSPWGIERLKSNNRFGIFPELILPNQTILIGNFGDGHINAFDGFGRFLGQLKHNGSPLEIEGLWSISYPPQGNDAYMDSMNRIYFTSAPDEESHGVFGYITETDDHH